MIDESVLVLQSSVNSRTKLLPCLHGMMYKHHESAMYRYRDPSIWTPPTQQNVDTFSFACLFRDNRRTFPHLARHGFDYRPFSRVAIRLGSLASNVTLDIEWLPNLVQSNGAERRQVARSWRTWKSSYPWYDIVPYPWCDALTIEDNGAGNMCAFFVSFFVALPSEFCFHAWNAAIDHSASHFALEEVLLSALALSSQPGTICSSLFELISALIRSILFVNNLWLRIRMFGIGVACFRHCDTIS